MVNTNLLSPSHSHPPKEVVDMMATKERTWREGGGEWLADAAETRASVADHGTTPQGHMDFSVVERKDEDHQDPRARQELALSQPAPLTGMQGQRRTHMA